MIEMTSKQRQTQEEVLAAAHQMMSGRIDNRPPGANDDADADYAEDQLLAACRSHAAACEADHETWTVRVCPQHNVLVEQNPSSLDWWCPGGSGFDRHRPESVKHVKVRAEEDSGG